MLLNLFNKKNLNFKPHKRDFKTCNTSETLYFKSPVVVFFSLNYVFFKNKISIKRDKCVVLPT